MPLGKNELHFLIHKSLLLPQNNSQLPFTCSTSTIETLEKGVKFVHRSGVFIDNFEHISQLLLVFPLLILNK